MQASSGVRQWLPTKSYHLVRSTMVWSYSCKLCLILVWIGVMCTTGHCQRFRVTNRTTNGSTVSLTAILSSVTAVIALVGIFIGCCVFFIRLAIYQKLSQRQPPVTTRRRRGHRTPKTNPLPQYYVPPVSSSGHREQTVGPTTNQDNRQTVQEPR